VNKRFWSVLCLGLAACTSPVRTPPPGPSAQPTSVAALAAAIAADAKRSDKEANSKAREDLAADADRDAQDCLAREPQAVACLYGQALALGLEARAHPVHAIDSLKQMLEALTRAEAQDPGYDEAGPARVRALVLLRAPGWPLGPGDADAGLAAARRAAALRPQYPPNLLALAEALAKTGDANGALQNYTRARDTAQGLPASDDRDEWLHEAEQGMTHK
jgi:hypothetical protein